jgi:hypothetical protein
MNRRSLVTRILMIDGVLLLVVATLYFILINSATSWLEERISPLEKAEVMPLFLMNHIAVGILLIPLALSTFYCAWGVKKRQHWSRVVSVINGLSLLSLPVVLSLFMGAQYYGSFLFLLATVLIVVVGITMLVPLVWFPKDIPETRANEGSKQAKETA